MREYSEKFMYSSLKILTIFVLITLFISNSAFANDLFCVHVAMGEQNLILGDVRAAKHVAQSLSSDVLDRALRGDLIATIYGDLGTYSRIPNDICILLTAR